MKILTVILICGIIAIAWAFKPLPKFLHVCHRSDPKLNECIQESIELLRSKLDKGIPELFIPPIEPLQVPIVKIEQSTGPVHLHSTYSNIHITGLSRYSIRDVRADLKKDKFRLKLWFPKLYLNADYLIQGKIMMMPLQGNGICNANFTDVDITAFMQSEKYKKAGINHMRIKDIHVKYTIGDSSIHLGNLFNGNHTLGNTMNTFINENWKSVAAEIRPVIQDTVSDLLRKSSEKLFENFSYDQLLPP